jgi:hypothetical protein
MRPGIHRLLNHANVTIYGLPLPRRGAIAVGHEVAIEMILLLQMPCAAALLALRSSAMMSIPWRAIDGVKCSI